MINILKYIIVLIGISQLLKADIVPTTCLSLSKVERKIYEKIFYAWRLKGKTENGSFFAITKLANDSYVLGIFKDRALTKYLLSQHASPKLCTFSARLLASTNN